MTKETDKRVFVCIVGEIGHLLVIKRSMATNNGGQIGLPGGHLNEGEDTYQGATREVFEELGLILTNFDVCLRRTVGKRTILYLKAWESLRIQNLKIDTMEVHSVQWMRIDEVHALEAKDVHRSLQLVREAYDEQGLAHLCAALS